MANQRIGIDYSSQINNPLIQCAAISITWRALSLPPHQRSSPPASLFSSVESPLPNLQNLNRPRCRRRRREIFKQNRFVSAGPDSFPCYEPPSKQLQNACGVGFKQIGSQQTEGYVCLHAKAGSARAVYWYFIYRLRNRSVC